MADEQEQYVVQIPGVKDIIRIPPLDDKRTKLERLQRWTLQATQTSIPEPLRWLPEVINWLDDAQDILITALVLAKPILRRLPSRFIPYLGWALLANDVFNIFTAFLSAPLVPRARKVHFIQHTKRAVAGRKFVVDSARTFLLPGRIRWIPFALQAGQVADTFTGWGLQLGGVMGAVSELFWSRIRELGGARVKIAIDDSWTPIAKAAGVMARSFYWRAFTDVANPQEISIMVNAINACATFLGAPNIPELSDERLRLLGETTVPMWKPWNKATRDALRELGWDPDADTRVPVPGPFDNLDYATATQVAIAHDPRLDLTLAAHLRNTDYDWPYGLQADEFSQWTWDVFAGGYQFVVPLNSPMESILSMALETAVVPPMLYWPEDARIIEQEQEAGVKRLPLGVTAPSEPGKWKIDPHITFKAPYPPPDDDPNIQLAHWCAIALALYCKRKIMIPQYVMDGQGNHRVFRWTVNDRGHGKFAPWVAAGLVWGQNLTRLDLPDADEEPKPGPKPPWKKYCFDSGTNWPSLSGHTPELDALVEILQAIPKDADVRMGMGPWPLEWGEPFGRDWLDGYMQSIDARRLSHPSNIPLDHIPAPEPWFVNGEPVE